MIIRIYILEIKGADRANEAHGECMWSPRKISHNIRRSSYILGCNMIIGWDLHMRKGPHKGVITCATAQVPPCTWIQFVIKECPHACIGALWFWSHATPHVPPYANLSYHVFSYPYSYLFLYMIYHFFFSITCHTISFVIQ